MLKPGQKELNFITIDLCGEALELHSSKSLWWPAQQTLIISDLHIGKAGHFRKHGMAVSSMVNKEIFWNLSALLVRYHPQTVVFLGDLFHSELNTEWHDFTDFLAMTPEIRFVLISGNHDVLDHSHYAEAGIEVVSRLDLGPFRFVHEVTDSEVQPERYTLGGHVHPGIWIKGRAKQSAVLPCFYFGPGYGLLPAFGAFTGLHKIQVSKNDRVYAVAGDMLLQVNGKD